MTLILIRAQENDLPWSLILENSIYMDKKKSVLKMRVCICENFHGISLNRIRENHSKEVAASEKLVFIGFRNFRN